MSTPKSVPITISASQRAILEALSRSRTASKRNIDRAKLLLHLEGHPNSVTAKVFGCNQLTVKRLRKRWLHFTPVFDKIEKEGGKGKAKDLKDEVLKCLADAPRSGAPPTYSAEQYCQILAVCLEDPRESGRPITHWTHAELADEIHKRGIATISRSHLGSFLKRKRPQTPYVQILAQPPLHAGGARGREQGHQ